MTKRLYYTDSYLIQFKATVQEHLIYQNHPAVILDQSAFYPTGGGQPYDTGTLNDNLVIEVVKDQHTGQVIHLLNAPLAVDSVIGKIDWGRRFDFMQQHSGQHILSQALVQIANAETVGFHLSQTYTTIDLAFSKQPPKFSDEILIQGEILANNIIYDNRDITAKFVTQETLTTIPLRKQPALEIITGPIRVVEIKDFDWSACGGTHVAKTGEIGIIKIIKTERKKNFLRLTFLCGQRALHHYEHLNRRMREIALSLSVSVEETLETIQQQSENLKQALKERQQLNKVVMTYKANALLDQALSYKGVSIVSQVFANKDIGEVRQLAQQIIQQNNCIVLFGMVGAKGQLIFARSADLSINMTTLLKDVGNIIGGGGGGSPHLAQGGGSQADKVPVALAEAQNRLKDLLWRLK